MPQAFPDEWLDALAFPARVGESSTSGEVLDAMESVLAPFGIDAFVLTRLPEPELPLDEASLGIRWPEEFLHLYTERSYEQDDPIFQKCKWSFQPFEWDFDNHYQGLETPAGEVMRLAAEYGLRRGYAVPIHGPNGYEGCVGMSGAEPEITAPSKPFLHLIALHGYERMRRLRCPPFFREPRVSQREREVLSLVAVGRSTRETAYALAIAERTVHEHVRNAAAKLGAANRVHAVAIAVRDGLIEL